MIVTGVTMEGFANFKSLAEIPSHPVAFLEPSLSICLPIKVSSTSLKLNGVEHLLFSLIFNMLG